MAFCPQCRFEYQASVKACPECKVDLIEKLADSQATSDEDFVEVYSLANRMEADVVRALFDEGGIPYLIRDNRIFPVLPDWHAEFIVEVGVSKEIEARRLLQEARTDGALSDQGKMI